MGGTGAGKPAARRGTSFPYWVTLLSLGLALLLFFGNTAPAVREREELQTLADELTRLRSEFDVALAQHAPVTAGDGADLQSLLVAIDKLGYTPAELLLVHPERRSGVSAAAAAAAAVGLVPDGDALPADAGISERR